MESNPKKNYIYNLIYQVLLLIIPLVTAPYLSRVLGANGIGIYSYNYAIVYYFMLLTLLGVNNYGNRTIAKNRDDKEQLSRTFWGIFILQLIMGFIMTLLYLLYILLFDIAYEKVAIVQILFIISAILDINWFFLGIEEFKKTITRNSLVKIATILLIFIFIKSESDLTKYTFIMASMTCLSQLFLWLFIRKKIVFVKLKKNDITKHIKPNIVLFIPVIAVSLYKMMDKIMLGSLANTQEVGFYENAEKIANLPLIFITALGTVMLPRMSNIVKQRDDKKMIEYIDKSIIFVMFISFAMAFGLMAIGNDFAQLFFGSEFQKSGILIVLLATTLPFLSTRNFVKFHLILFPAKPCFSFLRYS